MDYYSTVATTDTSIPTSTLYQPDPAPSGISPSTMDIITGSLSAFGQLSSAYIQSQNLKTQARQAELESKQAALTAKQEVNARREQLLQSLAQQRATAGSSGLALSSGSVVSGMSQSEAVFRREASRVTQEAELASITGQTRRRLLNSESNQALFTGVQRAGIGLLESSYRRQRRGSAGGSYYG